MAWDPHAVVTIDGVDLTGNTLNGLNINYGRPTIWDQSRASYATISILNTTNTDYAFEINDPVTITVEDSSAVNVTVFTGVITEISNEIAASGSSATVAVQTITAIGSFAQMSRTIIGNTNWPKEYDDDRINRIFTDAGVTIDTVDTPGVYEFTARNKNPQDAYSLAASYASQAFGYIYETKTGAVGYANESRRTVDVNANGYFDIDEGYINWRGINSRKSISDILNRVILFYKDNDEVTSEDTHSITQYGLYEGRLDTELENEDEAQNVADRLVSLRSIPETNFSSFNINLDNPNITATDLDDLLDINMGTAFQIDNLPNPISPITYKGFVEGWTLTINERQALLTIISSDSAYSVVPIRWQDVDPTTIWTDIDPSATRSTKTNLTQNPSFEPVNYGQLGYIYLPGIATYFLSSPDEAALDITGDIDIRCKVALDDWTPTSNNNLIAKNDTNNYSYVFGVLGGASTGKLYVGWTTGGITELTAVSTIANTITDGQSKWIRVTLDVNNGAGGRTAKFYTSDDGTNWTQLGSDVITAGTTSIFSGTGTLRIGSFSALGTTVTKGKIYAASIRNGIDGTEVFQFDIGGNWKSTDIDSFTAQTGQTVTLNPPLRYYGWDESGNPGTTATGDRVTAPVYSGSTSLKFTTFQTATTHLFFQATANLNQRLAVANGDTIFAQIRMRQGIGNRQGQIRIRTYATATGTTLVEEFISSATNLSTSSWSLIQRTATLTNASSLYAEIWISMLSGSINDFVYIDAVQIEKNSGGYAAYYFDGSYSDIPADRDGKLAWSGTQNFSSSTANAYWGTKPTTTWDNVDIQGLP